MPIHMHVPISLKSSRDAFNYCCWNQKGSSQEFIFEEEGFFEIFKNKFPLQLTRYTVISYKNPIVDSYS